MAVRDPLEPPPDADPLSHVGWVQPINTHATDRKRTEHPHTMAGTAPTEGTPIQSNASRQRPWKTSTIAALATAGVCGIVLFRVLLFEPFSIPSGSMLPTLLVGDYLVASKYPYGFSRFSLPFSPDLFRGRVGERLPRQGDVVTFKFPRDTSIDYIKRVVGLPGDRVQMRGGQLYINGTICPRQPAGDYIAEDNGTRVPSRLYHETLPNGAVHDILKQTDEGSANNTPEFRIPEGNLFVLGDNRDNSLDSRFMGNGGLGFVPVENLVGRAEFLFWSMEDAEQGRDAPNVRWNRLLQAIH